MYLLVDAPQTELPGTPSLLPDGPMCDSTSKRTLYFLKATLNTAFAPDYDFSYAKSNEFSREPSFDSVRRSVDGAGALSMTCSPNACSKSVCRDWRPIRAHAAITVEGHQQRD